MTCGGTMSGNCAIGSARSAISPASVSTIEMTAARRGRRDEDVGDHLSRPRRGGVDDDAGADLVQALDDDVLALGEPARRSPPCPGRCGRPRPGAARPCRRRRPPSRRRRAGRAATACCGTVSTVAASPCSSATRTSAPSSSDAVGVVEARPHRHGVGALADVGADVVDRRRRADRAVPFGRRQAHGRRSAPTLAGGLGCAEVEHARGRDREVSTSIGVEPRQRDERAAVGADERADVDGRTGRRCRRRAR